MTVSIISITAMNAGEDVRVSFETVNDSSTERVLDSFIISSKQYFKLGLEKGQCELETYDEVAYGAEVWRAVKRGTLLLGYGAYSEKALLVKLVSKGFDKKCAADAVEELVSRGLLCAADDATREAQRMADKFWGKKRITSALYDKGYSSDAVVSAIERLVESEVDFVDNCRALIEKRYAAIPDDPRERQKVFASLQRYGYSLSEIKAAIDTL